MFRFVTLTQLVRNLSSRGAVDNVESVMAERESTAATLARLEVRCPKASLVPGTVDSLVA